MDFNRFEHLLNQINSVSRRYDAVKSLTAENFNVFRILKMESAEVKMHSAFISELLNPKGSHGQKDRFLKIFVDKFCFKGQAIQTDKCVVEVEKHLGFISYNEKEGGRIDIVITDPNYNRVIIENKVYAKDGKYQLLRYHNYSHDADIIYLSLDGVEPSEQSKQHLRSGIDYKCISYKKDILWWLRECHKEVPILPVVREGITHYINLIKYLTNQTSSKEMKNEITDLMVKNLEESFLIADNLDSTCDKILVTFKEKLIQELQAKKFNCLFYLNFNNRYNSIWIWKENWKYLCIGFGFQNYDKDMRYGFLIDPAETVLPDELRRQITNLPNNHSNAKDQWWPWACPVEQPLNNWSKYNAWKAVLNGTMQEYIFKKIDELVDITKDFDI